MNEDEIDISSDSSVDSGDLNVSSILLADRQSDPSNDNEIDDIEKTDDDISMIKVVKSKKEILFDDLPEIAKIDMVAKLDEMEQIGRIDHILEKLVVVASFKNKPPLDLDSVLFMKDCLPLGAIFETFGPVKQPFYSIRFNSSEEISSRGIQIGFPVYFLPQQTKPTTKYVFVKDLLSAKGSDASWKDDEEPPAEFLEFSDDEEERKFKRELNQKQHQQQSSQDHPMTDL